MSSRPYAATLAIVALVALGACQKKEPDPPAPTKSVADESAKTTAAAPAPAESAAAPAPATAPQPNPERNAYFGETHLHTSWSVDAWVMGNRIAGPDDAYKYAQGQTIKHPMGFDIKIDTPLDFMGVTDHSEYVGVTKQANTPGSYVSTLPAAQPMIMKDPTSQEEQNRVFSYLLKLNSGAPVKALMDPKITSTVWKENVQIADAQNKPGKFTAFCSYEWTSMPDNRNMHRNVFFRACDKVPDYPFSSLDSTRPTELWNWMDAQRKAGNELLAISHNANVSDGWMYPVDIDNTTGRPIDAAWAESRMRNERLVEIKQGKGQSETHPLLSPNDEFANYELFQAILGLPADVGRIDRITGSFARQALKDGIAMQDTRGYNPYKFGMAGGSDSHNSASPYRQDNFFGLHADADGTVERRFAGVLIGGTMDVRLENPGGLTGVWAEENTRASLWDAMYRKETFGVTGPRIKVRLFGGWGYNNDIVKANDWVKQSYAGGVPMGADLPPMPAGGKGTAPSFVVWAVKDPTSGNLDRIQVVKGWTQNGQSFEKVFDVAWSGDRKPDKWTGRVPAIQSTVDLDKATYTNSVGSAELKTVWTDPGVRREPARVLLRPRAGDTHAALDPHPGGQGRAAATRCRAADGAGTRLELADLVRAVGRGAQECSRRARPSAELDKKGAGALNDAQLKALIVGKAIWLRNNVTGEQFFQPFTAEGQTTVLRVGAGAVVPERVRQRRARRLPGNDVRLPHRGRQARHPRGAGPVFVHVLQGRQHLLRRAQQRVRLRQLRDRSCAADRSQSADGAVQPVLDRARADGRAEEADRSDPPAGAQATRRAEEGHQTQRPAEGGGVAQDGRLLRREDLAAAQCGPAEEVPGPARADAAADHRGGGRTGAGQGESGRGAVVRRCAQVAAEGPESESRWIRRSGSGRRHGVCSPRCCCA